MGFTPAPMRHALGEYYTPDWLAAHVIDTAGWDISQSLLDPTCGSGTFILEGLRRRLEAASPTTSARELLNGLYGFDLNPLAVLTARASIVVFCLDGLTLLIQYYCRCFLPTQLIQLILLEAYLNIRF